MKPAVIVFLIATLLLTLGSVAKAQSPGTGSIVGAVLDDTGAVMAGATVTITGSGGFTKTATTTATGEFRFDGLTPGTYNLTANAQGFKELKSAPIEVAEGQVANWNATLTPAGVATNVEVKGQTVTQVETENAQIAGTLTTKEIVSIGLNGRNFTQLIALAPGVSNQTGQDEALVGVKGSVKYSVNGGRVEYNTFDVDGGDVLNASINGSSSTLIVYPSLDAISDLQILTSNYGAMYGRSASGTTLAVTKAGGSAFHGDAYFFARNEIFNSRNFFDITKHAPLYQKYDPGFTIGGPVYIPGHYNSDKTKTFFFFSEEYRHEREPVDFNQAVPSLAERNCALAAIPNPYCGAESPNDTNAFYADFSDVCPSVMTGQAGVFAGGQAAFSRSPGGAAPFFPDCPNSTSLGSGVFETFPGNLVPITANSNAILGTNIIPAPNSSTGCNSTVGSCYDAAVSPLTTWREELFRIDQIFTPSEKIYVRYIHDSWSTVVPTPQWGFVHNSFPTIQNNFVGPGTSVVAHLSSTISNRLVNDLALAYSVDHISLTDIPGPGVSTLAPPAQITADPCFSPGGVGCGIGYIFNNKFGGKIPGIVIGGSNAEYGGKGFSVDPSYMPWRHTNPTFSPRDDATLALGKHTLDFGILAIIATRTEINPPVGANTGDLQGIVTFSNVNTFFTTGNAFADFETATIQSYQQDSAQNVYHNNYNIVEPYIQDDWKVTPHLTLNLGLRVSLFGLYHESNLLSYNWVPSQFSSALSSDVQVNPKSGNLQFVATGNPVPLDLNNVDPHLVNGVVRCGVDNYANGKKVPSSCMSGHLFNPAPRIGIAWDPFRDGKTSLRAGYGIFFEHGTGNESNTGSLEGSPGNASNGGVLDMTQFYPAGWSCIGDAAMGCPGTGGTFPLNLTSIPTKVRWPYNQQWSLSVQRQMPWDMLGSVAYVGSKGTHLTAELQVNQLVPLNASQNPFPIGQPLTGDICGLVGQPFPVPGFPNNYEILPGTPGYVNFQAACEGLLSSFAPGPNSLRLPGTAIAPGLGQIFSLQNIANSSYNALQMSLRRTKGPLTLGVSYTYSHSIDDSSDRTSLVFVNAYNLAQSRASSDFDQRHLLSISYVYELPIARFVSALHGAFTFSADEGSSSGGKAQGGGSSGSSHPLLLKGWELAGIVVHQNGTPFSVLNGGSSNFISVPDNAGVAAVIGPGSYPDVVARTPEKYRQNESGSFGPLLADPSQFVAPTGLTYGDAGRNFLNNPGRTNFDTSLLKSFAFKEPYTLQFRLETFNTFNHTQFRVYDPSNPGNIANNIVNCYGSESLSAGDPSCLAGNSFLHPVDAHRPRTVQLGVKFLF